MFANFLARALLLVFAFVPPARAELTYTESDDNALTIIRMMVTPAAEPVPAFTHRLVSRDIDLKSGNAAPYYYRALLDLPKVMEHARKEFGDDFDNWYISGGDATPIEKLPLEQVRKAVSMTSGPIREGLMDAVSRRTCDWQLDVEGLRGSEVISFLLPEFQTSRELGRLLALRARLAIAERRYDDAIESMRMSYRLGRDVAQPPFLVCALIGIAIEQINNGTLLELIAAPDSPNLYWALTDLTSPPVDLRPAVRFELEFGPRMFPFFHHAETTERAPQEWNRLFTRAVQDLQYVVNRGPTPRTEPGAGVVATGLALVSYSHAKEQLVAEGMNRERVEKMAVGHVLAIYTERIYRRFADRYQRLWYLPFWEMQKRGQEVDDELRGAGVLGGGENREVLPIVETLLPAMHAARAAQVRLERDIAAMRVIEALRMHAAAHDGKLPEKLDDIDRVPVPHNPATGNPFVYRLDGATAILELPSSDRIPGYNRRFEIQVANK